MPSLLSAARAQLLPPAGRLVVGFSGGADSTALAHEYLDWHKGGGSHEPGLLWRRVAECKIFFFENYAEAFHSHENYFHNTYGFIFPSCCADEDQ